MFLPVVFRNEKASISNHFQSFLFGKFYKAFPRKKTGEPLHFGVAPPVFFAITRKN